MQFNSYYFLYEWTPKVKIKAFNKSFTINNKPGELYVNTVRENKSNLLASLFKDKFAFELF